MLNLPQSTVLLGTWEPAPATLLLSPVPRRARHRSWSAGLSPKQLSSQQDEVPGSLSHQHPALQGTSPLALRGGAHPPVPRGEHPCSSEHFIHGGPPPPFLCFTSWDTAAGSGHRKSLSPYKPGEGVFSHRWGSSWCVRCLKPLCSQVQPLAAYYKRTKKAERPGAHSFNRCPDT